MDMTRDYYSMQWMDIKILSFKDIAVSYLILSLVCYKNIVVNV